MGNLSVQQKLRPLLPLLGISPPFLSECELSLEHAEKVSVTQLQVTCPNQI